MSLYRCHKILTISHTFYILLYQNTALHIAAIHGHTDILQYLMEQGADMLRTDNSGKTCLDAAIDNLQNDVAIAIIKHRR